MAAMPDPADLPAILERLRRGDEAAREELLPFVYDELHRLAQRALARAPVAPTLQTTALLNEAWMRVGEGEGRDFEGREHFLAVAARAMRSVLVDHARRRASQKRGGGVQRLDLDEVVELMEARSEGLVALDDALNEFAEVDETMARIVELRFFGGMTHPEIARALGQSLRSVERSWSTARAWLYAQLDPAAEAEER